MPRRRSSRFRIRALSACALTLTVVLAGLASGLAGAAPSAQPLPLLPHVAFYPTTTMRPSSNPVPLPRVPGRVADSRYRYRGTQRTVDDYLARTSTRGFLVVHGGRIVDERYSGGYSRSSRFNSWSVGKSITATAVGIALSENKIDSIDDPIARYLPELSGSGFNGVPIAAILAMSSGQRYEESNRSLITASTTDPTIRLALGEPLTDQAKAAVRAHPAGTVFAYSSLDTFVLGWLVSKVTGMPLADYVEQKIWRPAGMASTALVGQDYSGSAIAFASYHATTRDFARFGLLYLHDGVVRGRQVVPADWVRAATTTHGPHVAPRALSADSPYGYGYQWWIGEGDRGDFLALGILGQFIYVSPRDDVVIVQNSEDLAYDATTNEALFAFRAIADSLRH